MPEPASKLLTALWGETVSKIDTFVLETRHLQLNIIRVIRKPSFYRILEYEQEHIWGREAASLWHDYLESHGLADIEHLVDHWVVRLPQHGGVNPGLLDGYEKYCDYEELKGAWEEARNWFDQRSLAGGWGFETQRLYNILAAAQTLKANVLKDKFILCYWGDRAFRTQLRARSGHWTEAGERAAGRFLTIRSGVLFRLREYINRLRDMRSPVERSLDISTVDDPRPLTMRRKGQGIYNEFLSERSRHHHKSIKDFLQHTKDISWHPLASADLPEPTMHHRWKYDAISSYAYLRDDVATQRGSFPRSSNAQHFINTSFWMADRPDLQPVIAHEIAHYFLQEVFDDVGEEYLKDGIGEMGKLIRSLSKVFHYYRSPTYDLGRFPIEDLELIREIAVDLLAAVPNPHAYLWALFTEIVGLDLFESLQTPDQTCDLKALMDAETASPALRFSTSINSSAHLWAVRLIVLCEWVELIDDVHERNSQARETLKGVQDLIELLLSYADQHSPLEIAAGRGRHFIEALARGLKEELQTHRVTRSARRYVNSCVRGDPYDVNHRSFLMSGRLPDSIRRKFFERTLKAKSRRLCRHGARSFGNGRDLIAEYFGSSDDGASNDEVVRACAVFPTLTDVPWMAFMLRVTDFTLYADASQVFKEILSDFNPGQDLYATALDVGLWLNSYPSGVLTRARHVVAAMLARRSTSDNLGELRAELEGWLAGSPEGVVASPVRLSAARFDAAESLIAGGKFYEPEALDQRRLGKISDLRSILSAHEGPVAKEAILGTMLAYLGCSSAAITKGERNKVVDEEIACAFDYDVDGAPPFTENGTVIRLNFTGATNGQLATAFEPNLEWLTFPTFGGPEEGSASQRGIERSVALTLGRFDAIAIGNSYYDHFVHLPTTSGKGTGDSRRMLPPFALRMERVYPFRNTTHSAVDRSMSRLCSTITIKLAARDDRIEFCLRLDRVRKGDRRAEVDPLNKSAGLLKDTELALTDGDADLLLFMFGDPRERLSECFHLGQVLRDDYLVEGCETVLSASCLNVFFESEVCCPLPYTLLLQVRLHRGGGMPQIVERAERHLRSLEVFREASAHRDRAGAPPARWRRTPGRLDFELALDPAQARELFGAANTILERSAGAIVNEQRGLAALALIFGIHEPARHQRSMEEVPDRSFPGLVYETITTIGFVNPDAGDPGEIT